MRIDDVWGRLADVPRSAPGRAEEKGQSAAKAAAKPAAAAGESQAARAERLQQIKAAIQSGQPVDLEKLADRLLETGIFFDKRV